jgi:molybdate transport system ATP-binding protein
MDLLTVKNLSVDLGNFSLKNVSFGVPEGSYCCLLGASGAGKSVLLETIIGGFRPRRGKVFLRGEDVTSWPPERRRLGIVYQDYMLFPHLDVYRNIAFGLVGKGLSGEEIRSRVKSISDHLDIADLMQRDIATLSGGEQQRTALARALITEPEILLLDEAFSALDVNTRERMRDLMSRIASEIEITVLHVTHDREDVWALASHVAVIHEGEMLQYGTPEAVFRRPRPGYVAGIVGARNLIEGVVVTGKEEGLGVVQSRGTLLFTSESLEGNSDVVMSVRPEDIIVARDGGAVSARNRITVVLSGIEKRGPLVWLTGRAGDLELVAVVTVSGFDALEISKGETCQFIFKASSLCLAGADDVACEMAANYT